MFGINVWYDRPAHNAQIAEIQNAYLSGMSLRDAEDHFGDYFLCVEAAIGLAIDKGWNLDAVLAKNLQYIYDSFYEDDLCGGITAEAMEYNRAAQAQNA